MSALDGQVVNQNFLAALNFAFKVKRAPGITWGVQELIIPGMSLDSPEQVNPFVRLPKPGDKVAFDKFQVSFRVDEDLVNYLEMFNWMIQLGFDEDFSQFAVLKDKPQFQNEGLQSELTVQLLKSNRLVNFEIVFHDAFPISLSDVHLTTTATEVVYPECTVVFDYSYFEINKL